MNLKKNTEQLGSIFDALPSQINGNIHSATNPSEPVIGYISVGNVSSQRIFITKQQLPSSWIPTPTYLYCQIDSEYYVYYFLNGSTIPVNQVTEVINYDANGFVPGVFNPKYLLMHLSTQFPVQ